MQNLPVYRADMDERLGNLADVLVDSGNSIRAILVETGVLIKKKYIIDYDRISQIAEGAVHFTGGERECGKRLPEGLYSYTLSIDKHGARDGKGQVIGQITDGVFDFGAGVISSVELGNGFADDLIYGRQHFTLAGDVEFGEELITISRGEIISKEKGVKRLFAL